MLFFFLLTSKFEFNIVSSVLPDLDIIIFTSLLIDFFFFITGFKLSINTNFFFILNFKN